MVTDGAIHRLETYVSSLVVALGLFESSTGIYFMVSTPSSTDRIPLAINSLKLPWETETL